MPSPTVLRPFSSKSDAAYLPVLIKASILSNISKSDFLFFTHPIVLSVILVLASTLLYHLHTLFFSALQLPGEDVRQEGKWQDSIALLIYALPPLTALLGAFYALSHWLHSRIWHRVAESEIKRVDVLDPEGYYKKAESSSFWCLEYDSEIVCCFGVDARNPGRCVRRPGPADGWRWCGAKAI